MRFLELLFSKHRRLKGETYFKNHLPFVLIFFSIFLFFSVDSLGAFFFVLTFIVAFDMILAFGAWLYFDEDL